MNAGESSRFLHKLYGAVDPSLYVLLWTLPDKQSRWFHADDLDSALTTIKDVDALDVYVGVGLSTKDRGKRLRTEAKDVTGIVGLWADIDIADETAHKKSNLPADEAEARKVIDACGARPTIVVHSGHGLQAWWLLDEPWVFTDAADHDAATALAARWGLTLRVRAAELGYVLDATHDLARVMRLPGTVNNKVPGHPVDVRVVDDEGPRMGVSDFDDYLADERALSMLSGRRTYVVGQVELHRDADVPASKFNALAANDKKFKPSWDRTRKDMHDDSASSYDLSLATIAAAAGLSDHDIANLIVASRRNHGDDPAKSLRHDYIARTIGRARDSHARAFSEEEIESARERVEHADTMGDPGERNHAVNQLHDHQASVLGVEVTRWVKLLSEPAHYRLDTPAGSVMIGTADDVLNQTKMRGRIADATRIVIPRFKSVRWDQISQSIFTACEEEDIGTEATDAGTGMAWVAEYLHERVVVNVDEGPTTLAQACETMTPYIRDGSVNIFGPHLRSWLQRSRGDRVTAARMGQILRACGCEHSVVHVKIGGVRSTRSAWRVPDLDTDDAPDPATAAA